MFQLLRTGLAVMSLAFFSTHAWAQDFQKQLQEQAQGPLEGFVIKKSMSFAIRTVQAELKGKTSTGVKIRTNRDITLFGLRTEFALKMGESANNGWFGGVSFGVLKGSYEQNLHLSTTGNDKGSGDVDSAFDADLFVESDYLLSPRWAFLTRGGLALALINQGDDKNLEQSSTNITNIGNSAGDGTIELFMGLGLDYAFTEKSTVSAMMRFSVIDLTTWHDSKEIDSGNFGIYGLQFSYIF